MKITRRFAVAALLVIAGAIVFGTPAPASAVPQKQVGRGKLYPVADSPLPHATGTLALYTDKSSGVSYLRGFGVSVSRLAPNASYYMPVTVGGIWSGTGEVVNVLIQTDAQGKGGSGFSAYPGYRIMNWSFQVYDSSGTLVLTSSR